MNTTIFVPMPEWQGLAFLRDRNDAFRRLLTPLGTHLDDEVVMENDEVFVGFRNRDGAIKTGFESRPQGFCILRIVLGKLLHGSLMLHNQVSGSHNHPTSGAGLWLVNRGGMQHIWEKANSGEVEILLDQIFGPCDPELCVAGCTNHQLTEEIGRLADDTDGGTGPTGYGGC